MDVNSLNRIMQAPPAEVPAIPTDQVAENREIIQAVKALNSSEMLGEDNQLTFQKDRDTQRMVVRVVNKKTNEIVSQIPPEYVLRLAAVPPYKLA
jgi:uncharacterized FlaG/YvyC family protein